MDIPIVLEEICEMVEYPIALFTKKFLAALKKFRSITDFLEKAQKMFIDGIDSYLA